MSIEKFTITGVNHKDLISTCEFLLSQTREIKSMGLDPEKRILVFYSYSYGNKGMRFPLKVTPTVLAEAISQFMEETPAEEFEKQLSGYEEEYDHAWEIFSPDWYSDEHGIKDYDMSAVLACRPVIVEYGK